MPDNNVEFFVAIERQVWEALKAADVEADASLLADDFLGVYDSGYGTKADHLTQIRNGPTVAHYEIDAAHLVHVSPSLAVLSYRAIWRHVQEQGKRVYYITSIWERRDNRWLNIFSQDTMDAASR